jgi:AAA-like domain
MRRFFSYGPLNNDLHYYVPREELINTAYTRLLSEAPDAGGHYITVWAPRQCGKSWIMREILFKLKENPGFDVLKINLEVLKDKKNAGEVIESIARTIGEKLGKDFKGIDSQEKFQAIFKNDSIDKPLILILDEFDALPEEGINIVVSAFRNIYINRMDESNITTAEKSYLLHGVALIGVRSVLGVENVKGSPFNVQQSLHIPNFNREEVEELFKWYEKDSGQKVTPEVLDRLYYETMGQPGLTCWFGELMCEGFQDYKNDMSRPISMEQFDAVYEAATYLLPNNNILNLISNARKESNKDMVLRLFQTDKKIKFRFDEAIINELYMNGIITNEIGEDNRYYIRFSSPFVQKRLFNYFSYDIFKELGQLVPPFSDLDHIMNPQGLEIRELMKLYQSYLQENSSWLFKEVPRRSDMRIYEAVFHFNLYAYLDRLLPTKNSHVLPEFPTGNGKIDLLIRFNDNRYGIELKSFTHRAAFKDALQQAASYGKKLGLKEIYLVVFVETINESSRKQYEVDCIDPATQVTVKPFFIITGNP